MRKTTWQKSDKRLSSASRQRVRKELTKLEKALLWIAFLPIATLPLRAIWYYWDYQTNTLKYMQTSFPWYTGLIIDAIISAGVLVIFITVYLIVSPKLHQTKRPSPSRNLAEV